MSTTLRFVPVFLCATELGTAFLCAFFGASFQYMLFGMAHKLKFSRDQFRFKASPNTGKPNVHLVNFKKYINLILFGLAKVHKGQLLLLLASLMALMLNLLVIPPQDRGRMK